MWRPNMSHYKLGAQGRAVFEQMSSQNQPLLPDQTQMELDTLIRSFSSPPNQTTMNNFAYYLPRIKNPENLRLVLHAFTESHYMTSSIPLKEVFYAIMMHKLSISEPSLPLNEFCEIMYAEISRFAQWKLLQILAGIIKSRGYYKQLHAAVYVEANYKPFISLYTRLFNEWFPLEKPLAVDVDMVLQLADVWNELPDQPQHPKLFEMGVDMVTSENYRDKLGPLSQVVSLQKVSRALACQKLEQLITFAANAHHTKETLFSVVMVLKSIVSQNIKCPDQTIYHKCIMILFYMNHVLLDIGSGGFDAYNYIFGVCSRSLKNYALVSHVMLGNIPSLHHLQKESRARLLFVLQFWENVSPSKQFYGATMAPVLRDTVTSSDKQIVEATHSVYLATMMMPLEEYFVLAMLQFPRTLSKDQFLFIMGSLGRKAAESDIPGEQREFLHSLYMQNLNHPHRVLVEALILQLPLVPVAYMKSWLNNISEVMDIDENYLCDKLWNTISKNLDLVRGDIALKWWFRNHPERSRL